MFMTAPIWPWARRLIQMKIPTIAKMRISSGSSARKMFVLLDV